jgi:N-hydroxyarylamine O-acetyltransferase
MMSASPAADIDVEPSLDLDAYLERIEWREATRPTFATLAALLRAHMRRIPFENLDVLLGRPVQLDLDALQRKLVRDLRGGYCFEHATLFGAALAALGFELVRHSARVVLITPRTESPRTHMFLTVRLPEGIFVVDPGFGSLAPGGPVALEGANAGGGSHWISRDGAYWTLRARTDDRIVDCWVSTLEPENAVDFEVSNHYTSTHRASPFVNRVMLRALTDDGHVAVMNRDVTIREGDASRSLQLADRAALRALLREYFGFDLPEVERLRVPSIDAWR